ncbi:DUF1552 domain-containing protein [Marinagarivorans algicola]|uniref:DUF1552 domain-containing protein n=1 Tax=Marinagarivorans algicola TaxID=1513270 RepID=UPI0006B461AC|nr:DUF1552 domain-containing protein [Marinagarivorans algicola]
MKRDLNRRTFLRSSATGISTAVGLPLLEAMFNSSSAFADAPGKYPRFFAMYVPNGIIEEKWFPRRNSKTDFNLAASSLKKFDEYGLKNDISLYRGMQNVCRSDGSNGNAHMIGISSWLTGVGIKKDSSQTHRPSLDQELADAMQAEYGRTKVHSLQLAGNSELDKPNNNNYFNPQKNALNWGSNNRLLPLKSALKNEFDKLYAGGGSTPGAGVDRRFETKISVLDDIKEDRQAMLKQLGASDRARLDQYFESLRDLEESLNAQIDIGDNTQECAQPAGVNNIPNPTNGARNNRFGDHARIAAKITAQAFACGLTHAVTYCTQGEAAGCHYEDIGINTHFHNSISHNRGGRLNDWVKIDTFHADLCAEFMYQMKNTPHGTGTLLDGTGILFGSGLGNGTNHSHDDLALMVGGHFGNWKHGNYHTFNGNRSHGDLVDTLRAEMGLPDLGKNKVPIQ